MIHIVKKSTPRFTNSPSLVLIGLVFTEIQAFKNVNNIYKEMYFVNLGVLFLTMWINSC